MTWTHAVVGCSDCSNLWIITAGNETSSCPRCGTQYPLTKLRKLATTTDKTHARELRGQLLAEQHGTPEQSPEETSYTTLEAELDTKNTPAAPSTSETETTPHRLSHGSKRDLLEHTIKTLEHPTLASIQDAMETNGIDPAQTEALLDKLRQDGSLIKENELYRVV